MHSPTAPNPNVPGHRDQFRIAQRVQELEAQVKLLTAQVNAPPIADARGNVVGFHAVFADTL
jgi:hypothetical protein